MRQTCLITYSLQTAISLLLLSVMLYGGYDGINYSDNQAHDG